MPSHRVAQRLHAEKVDLLVNVAQLLTYGEMVVRMHLVQGHDVAFLQELADAVGDCSHGRLVQSGIGRWELSVAIPMFQTAIPKPRPFSPGVEARAVFARRRVVFQSAGGVGNERGGPLAHHCTEHNTLHKHSKRAN